MKTWRVFSGATVLGQVKAYDAAKALKRARKTFPDAPRPLKVELADFVYGDDPARARGRQRGPSHDQWQRNPGRKATLRNFSGTVERLPNGQTLIRGKQK